VTGLLTGVLVLVTLLLAVAVFYLVARGRAGATEPGRPDRVTDEVVVGLMTEMRKWQAEAEHWKATAQRLQRELEQR
jgi:hypothetical protein